MRIVLTSHGELCEGIVKSYQMIAGDSSHIETVKLDEHGISDFTNRLTHTLDRLIKNDQVIVLCDLKGGTPYNETLRYALKHQQSIFIVSGFNLPMLIELGTIARTEKNISKLTELAITIGQSSISTTPITNDDSDEELDF